MKPMRAPIKPRGGENWDQFFLYARKNHQWHKYLRDYALKLIKTRDTDETK